jgi:ferredoxin
MRSLARTRAPPTRRASRLNPKKINEDMREVMMPALPFLIGRKPWRKGKSLPILPSQTIADDVLWSCTTCRACEQACPLFIEFIDRIVGMRRKLVLEDSSFPEELTTSYKNLEKPGIHGDRAPRLAPIWAQGLGIPVLADGAAISSISSGSAARGLRPARKEGRSGHGFDPEGSRGEVRDPRQRGILHRRPGAPHGQRIPVPDARRAKRRDAQPLRVKKVVAQCPHCFNALLNEYPQLGGRYEVLHHSQVIARLIADGRIAMTPCVLSGNGHVPRLVLSRPSQRDL